MKKFYPYLFIFGWLIIYPSFQSIAQSCGGLAATSVPSESRCMATGFITVSATGGSGTYNYKAVGPVATPFTSSNVITGLKPGFYTVTVKDINTGCEVTQSNVEVAGSYSDPRFGLDKTNVSCLGNDGTIMANGLQFGRGSFSYTVIAPSPAGVGTTNGTGTFSNLGAGEYFIQLQDSCGGIQVRRVTIEQYSWWFDGMSVTKVGCDSADAVITVRDNRGNINTSGTAFAGFTYGVVKTPGDTVWYNSRSFRFYIGKLRSITIVGKDDCGNIHATPWNLPNSSKPSVNTVAQSNFACATFTATIAGQQNLTAPEYCLYDNNNLLLECNYTGTFTSLTYGAYCIRITDVCYDTTIVRCFIAAHPVPAVDAAVGISNQNCTTFTATISGQTNLTNPDYCLYDATNTLIECNTSGIFSNIPYGSYCINIEDGCLDTTIARCFTTSKPVPVLNTPVVSGSTCTSFDVVGSGNGLQDPLYCLYDNLGNLIACDSSGNFSGIPHGSYCMVAISCGDTTLAQCFTTGPPVPSVNNTVQISDRTCTSFTATVTGQTNLTSPQYCLYDAADVLISCNTTGVFENIIYGSYCIKIDDGCVDTIITRCFTQARAIPTINATIQQLNAACSTFSARVTGTNLTTAQYCIYDSLDVLVDCNTSGTFDNLPYGPYCVRVQDACGDAFTVCQTFEPVRGITLSTSKSCTIGKTNIDVEFLNGNGPYIVNIVHPDGSTVFSDTTSSNPVRAVLQQLVPGLSYAVTGTDNCGQTDTASIVPDAMIATKSITAISKCPSATWPNGSGDLSVTCSSNRYTFRPRIIKKDGTPFVTNYSSNTGSNYLFNDLEPATYIVEYNLSTCNTKVYDTFALQPYSYPTQGQSALYQCDNNSFSLGADVSGGVSPYSFQIIGSMPETPSIISATQTAPLFTIDNGTTYSLVRLRTIDACGNATLSDLSVLPLQNISVSASALCYYDTVSTLGRYNSECNIRVV